MSIFFSCLTALTLGKAEGKEQRMEPMALEKARLFMLKLVNSDRAKYRLSPLTLDSVGTLTGQAHTDEMATVGYLSHWNTLGKEPVQRYTEAGGLHYVGENVAAIRNLNTSAKARETYKLKTQNPFSAADLQKLETFFMSEKPPNDGHRQQILAPEHNKLGIGLSSSVNSEGDSRLILAQEFLNEYGKYSALPKNISFEHPFAIAGTLSKGVKLYSISIYWEEAPRPMTSEELGWSPRACPPPYNAIQSFYVADKPPILRVWTKDEHDCFSVSTKPNTSWKAGLYFVEICAQLTKSSAPVRVSLRTTLLN